MGGSPEPRAVGAQRGDLLSLGPCGSMEGGSPEPRALREHGGSPRLPPGQPVPEGRRAGQGQAPGPSLAASGSGLWACGVGLCCAHVLDLKPLYLD